VPALAHQSGCQSNHSCPSDHHTYLSASGGTTTPTSGDPVVTIAGDISGGDAGTHDTATSDVVLRIDPTVALTAGDNAYVDGTLSEYQSEYDPTWGRFKAKTRPAPGNHDYHTAGAPGYFDYFDGAGNSTGPAGTRGEGYYSFDVGSWHLVALNNYVPMGAGSAQEQWLKADLFQHAGHCTLAYWHEPRFTSGAEHSNNTSTGPLWDDLYAAGADVVVNGHNHQYERFARQNPQGFADPAGIREFVVGTGGAGQYSFAASPQPNSEVRATNQWGVLKLTLRDGSYDWQFAPAAGSTLSDSGSTACHSAASGGGIATPTPTPTATPTPTPTPTPMHRNCVAGRYADRSCTPGAIFKRATRAKVCKPGYTRRVRHVSAPTKQKVFAEYGVKPKRGAYEIDRLIALEIGGSNSVKNLWPERYAGGHGARRKDVDEHRLHRQVCTGTLTLKAAQKRMVRAWSR
jgi:hypothetical protein